MLQLIDYDVCVKRDRHPRYNIVEAVVRRGGQPHLTLGGFDADISGSVVARQAIERRVSWDFEISVERYTIQGWAEGRAHRCDCGDHYMVTATRELT